MKIVILLFLLCNLLPVGLYVPGQGENKFGILTSFFVAVSGELKHFNLSLALLA